MPEIDLSKLTSKEIKAIGSRIRKDFPETYPHHSFSRAVKQLTENQDGGVTVLLMPEHVKGKMATNNR